MVTQWSTRPDAISEDEKRVDRATADIITGVAVPVFHVSGGRIRLTEILGEVTTIIGGASLAKYQFNPTTGTTNDMCGTLDIDSDEVGTLYSITGVPTDAMLRSESGAVRNLPAGGIILGIGDIEFLAATNRSGSISQQARYVPLDPGAVLVAV